MKVLLQLIFVGDCLPLVPTELSHLAILPNMCIGYILLSIPYTVDMLVIIPMVIFYP